ncbi:MAG: hypothetical protein ACTIIQ_05865 [Corynebacterium variabile]|uniref:hypothetical protein n=1 Tax=Corynebacterium variabile TaxID=1727 RepID=UPI003F976296
MASVDFGHFIDDAAVFPPGLASLPAAVANHLKNATLPSAPYIGPLVLPLKDIAEAAALANGQELDLSAVTPAGELASVGEVLDGLLPNTALTAVELKVSTVDDEADAQLEDAASFRSAHPDIAVWIELPAVLVTAQRLTWMKDHGLGLKFRTGGVRRALYPTPEDLLDVLGCAVDTDIPFKLTAGLHRAMRYSETVGAGPDEEQLDHFGFLNIAGAVAALRAGSPADSAADVLASDNGQNVTAATADGLWRESFTSFGCCSVLEALTTLSDLGAVDRGVLEDMTEPHDVDLTTKGTTHDHCS